MRWMQALVFCGGLIYAAVDDLKTRTVSDIVCIIIALAGLVTISPASLLGALLAMLPFYLCAGLGLMGGGDWRLAAAVGFVLGVDRVITGLCFLFFPFSAYCNFLAASLPDDALRGVNTMQNYTLSAIFLLCR